MFVSDPCHMFCLGYKGEIHNDSHRLKINGTNPVKLKLFFLTSELI